MLTVDDVITKLCKKYGWPNKLEDNMNLFQVTLEDGRTQLIAASQEDLGTENAEEDRCVDIRSVIGKVAAFPKERVLDLLKYNNRLVYARVEIDPTEEFLRVAGRTLLAHVDPTTLELMVKEIAINADQLEKEYFKVDDA